MFRQASQRVILLRRSANMAYDQMKLEALEDVAGECKDPDKLAKSG
jgi:hypothetical protein